MGSPETLEGQTVTITKDANGVVKFATAAVGPADVECSNGVIHVIDAVVLPPEVSTTQAIRGDETSAAYRSGVVVGFPYLLVLIKINFFRAGGKFSRSHWWQKSTHIETFVDRRIQSLDDA